MTTHEDQKRIEGFLADAAVWGDEYATVGLEIIAEVERLQQERDKYASGWRELTAEVEQLKAEYEKENLAQWILEAEQGRATIKRLTAALQEIWEAGDLNDEQVDAYERVIPFEGRVILPLYESSDKRRWYARTNGEKEWLCICGHGESSHLVAGPCVRIGCQCDTFHQRAKDAAQ